MRVGREGKAVVTARSGFLDTAVQRRSSDPHARVTLNAPGPSGRSYVSSRPARRTQAKTTVRIAAVIAFLVTGVVTPSAAFAAPSNDDFAAARTLSSELTGTTTSTNIGATKQPGEPNHAGDPGGHSVWFRWTAQVTGNESFTTEFSDFDSVIAVYTGSAVNALTAVASDDDLGSEPHGVVSFRVSAGVTYSIAVDGFQGKSGLVALSWQPSPPNDNFADAQVLTSATAGATTGSTRGATREPGEPESEVPIGRVWYSWTAPAAGTYKFDTVGSLVDTVVGIYRGSTLDNLTLVTINDDDPDRGCCSSWVPIRDVTAGTTYSIFVAPVSDSADDGANRGLFTLRWGPLVLGTRGADRLVGTSRSEEIRGGPGNDVIRARGGNDAVFGGAGRDVLRGGAGSDELVDHQGANRLFGNAGADRLDGRRGGADLLNGGPGRDRCLGNKNDTRRRCP
jgi:Ca2+-binding RTX toxin-like protein